MNRDGRRIIPPGRAATCPIASPSVGSGGKIGPLPILSALLLGWILGLPREHFVQALSPPPPHVAPARLVRLAPHPGYTRTSFPVRPVFGSRLLPSPHPVPCLRDPADPSPNRATPLGHHPLATTAVGK